MTPELFMQWKKKKIVERDANLAEQQAERAKNDRMRCVSSFHSLELYIYAPFYSNWCSSLKPFVKADGSFHLFSSFANHVMLLSLSFAAVASYFCPMLAFLWMMSTHMTSIKESQNLMIMSRRLVFFVFVYISFAFSMEKGMQPLWYQMWYLWYLILTSSFVALTQ